MIISKQCFCDESIEKKKKKITGSDVKKSIDRKIASLEKKILEQEDRIRKLQEELEGSKRDLEQYQMALEQLDLDIIAEQINNQ